MKTLTQTIMLLTLASALPAYCQSTPRFRADIPFTFRVGDKVLEAGTYFLQNVGYSSVTLLRSADGNGGAFAITSNLETRERVEPKLVFHQYGNNYFLWQIWTGPGGSELPMSRTERQIMAEAEDPLPEELDLALAK